MSDYLAALIVIVRHRAADLIERGDWWQATMNTPGGRGPRGQRCASVALLDAAVAVGRTWEDREWLLRMARAEVLRELRAQGGGAVTLADWNDTAERTKDEVLAALRGGQAEHWTW